MEKDKHNILNLLLIESKLKVWDNKENKVTKTIEDYLKPKTNNKTIVNNNTNKQNKIRKIIVPNRNINSDNKRVD